MGNTMLVSQGEAAEKLDLPMKISPAFVAFLATIKNSQMKLNGLMLDPDWDELMSVFVSP